VGHSHLGHGLTAKNEEELGWFGGPDGNLLLIGDIHQLREESQRPGIPYFILGHSMGSFLTRQYLTLHGEGLSGAVIMGTSDMPGPVVAAARTVSRILAAVKGWQHRSALVSMMVTDGFAKKYGPGWLSRNPENVKAYAEDPFCGFRFTLNGYYYMFLGLYRAIRAENGGSIQKEYPLLFTAGAEDPVGNNGKGVRALFSRYRKFGANASIKLYPGDRHEILQESDRQQIFEDILQWMMQNQ
jgi:alpha-beta hydrolase superfamily lysophospholipase